MAYSNLPTETADGLVGVSMFLQDQIANPLNVPMLLLRNTQTIAVDTVMDSYTVEVTPGNTPVVGDVLDLRIY